MRSQPNVTRRKALIVLSSARWLPLAAPAGHRGISTGFFLIELAQVLREFQGTHDFVLATPDGQTPQLDINGLSLPMHATAQLGATAMAVAQEMAQPDFDLARYRQRHAALVKRRDEEVALAIHHLGALPLSAPLPNGDPEAAQFADALRARMAAAQAKPYHAVAALTAQHRDPTQAFSFADFDFAYFPGGHAPMVDFHDNPVVGDLLRQLHTSGVLISLICHAPVALTSTGLGLATDEHNPFAGATLTTVPTAGELFMLEAGYPKVPGQTTRLTYYVDQALKNAGFAVETTENAAAVHLAWDARHRLLTGNGPQSVDAQADRIRELLG